MSGKQSDSPARYALPHVQAMEGYIPGMQPQDSGWIKINTNENPNPPSPRVLEAISQALAEDGARLRLYPNPTSGGVRATIANHHGVAVEQVLVGNGCDDILNLLIRAYCGDGLKAAMMEPSYSLYPVLSNIQNGEILQLPFAEDMSLDEDAIVNSGANVFFITNPNAPTGVTFAPEVIARIAERFVGLLVIDETYAPFAETDCVGLLAKYSNVVIARSFSKAYCLAGMRIGYALAHPDTISILDRVRDSYNVDLLAQAAATAALEDVDYYRGIRDETVALREEYRSRFEQMGWFVYPSQGNFLFVQPCQEGGEVGAAVAESLFQHLTANKILVRYFPKHALTQSFLRISIGSALEMQKLIEVITPWQTQKNV